MYVGSGGVTFALFKYMQLLQSGQMKNISKLVISTYEKTFNKALSDNKSLVDKLNQKQNETSPSFFRSASIGISTLECLHELHKPSINFTIVHELISKKILPAIDLCN